ncbi:S41 family peptidase [Pedobacter alpinus]|uniref:S41 family peptidase n=1 Tax=Pedobacter alpinus TaxID=1590643 RepID=A0ABW5TW40_9SPHI
MKTTLIIITFLITAFSAKSQILNPGFEQTTPQNKPLIWGIKPPANFSYTLDTVAKHSGINALKITGTQTSKTEFVPFSQIINISVNRLENIKLTAFIKTQALKGNAALWCQIWDRNDKQIGFQNSEMQDLFVNGDTDWKKYNLVLSVDTNAKKLLIGGYVSGDGTAWFDDFNLEQSAKSAEDASQMVSNYVKEFKTIVKTNSIYTDSLNWEQIDKDLQQLAKGLNTISEAKVLTDYIIKQLRKVGDNHSFVQSKTNADNYTRTNSNPLKPKAKLLGSKIGYIYVPGFASTNKTVSLQFTDTIQNLIKNLEHNNPIKNWVVDLRDNTGGNMYPMIAGLGPLIGDGTLGYFIKATVKEDIKNRWFYKNGATGTGKNSIILKLKNSYLLKHKAPNVAVLIGKKTSSSGEMTAMSFIGKPNLKTFGQATGGYTTGNRIFRLSNGTALVLATSLTADRNKKRYLSSIMPDVVVEKTKDDTDAELKAAENWLLNKD